MLKRIEGLNGGSGLRWMDWDAAAALGRKALGWFALAVGMFLLCGARFGTALAPFAMAFLAAALAAGRSAAALLAGCLAGAAGGTLRDFNLRLPVGAAVVLGGGLAWELSEPALERAAHRLCGLFRRLRPGRARHPAPRRQARSPNRRAAAVCSAMAGSGVLIPGLAFAGEALWPEAVSVAAASVAAVAAAPFFRAALEVRPARRRPDPEARAGICLLAGLAEAGLMRLSGPAAMCAGGALAQLMYPGGALAGVGIGAALLAMGADPRLPVMLAAGGAAAQLCAGLSRNARTAGACGAMLAAGLLQNAPPAMLAGAGASALAVLPLPGAWARAAAELARPAPAACDPGRLAARLQRESVRRLRALGDAFGDLAEGYRATADPPGEQALIRRLRARLCEGCAGYAGCWDGGDGGARLLCDLIALAVERSDEAPLFEGEVPPELTRRCRRGRRIPERLQEPLEDFARARRNGLRRDAENRLISAQFSRARRLLEGLAERQAQPLRLRERRAGRAAAALERAGIRTESVMALGGREPEIVAALESGRWTPALARAASAQLSRAFGGAYEPAGGRGRERRFVRRPRLRVRTGVVCASGRAGQPCGDSHLCCLLDGERLLALICDGMGSGDAAARESAVAVRLLGRLLRAGADPDLAIRTVNALLLNRGGDDMFATADLLILDLTTGEACFAKLAACPTLLLRGGELRRVDGGRLPMGILEDVRPGLARARLAPGDVLLMASDGAMDAAGEDALLALLRDGPRDMPGLARRAAEAARAAGLPGRRDDMTVICLRVEERQNR